jgi:hypothetical protein
MRSLIITLLLVMFISCDKKESPSKEIKSDSVIVYDETVYYKITHGMIKVVDTACISEEAKAKTDIKNGKLTYTFTYGMGYWDYSNIEMKRLLDKYSIDIDTLRGSCIPPLKGFRRYCYQNLMNTEIELKFGEKFIDSLRHIADVEFINNHPKFVFHFWDCDTTSRYAAAKTYDEYLKMPKEDFLRTLSYGGLTKRELKKLHADTEVEFILYRNGSIGQINAKSDLSRVTNKDFAAYFEKEAIDFVKRAKWKPAKYRGIEVNSEMHLNLYNK